MRIEEDFFLEEMQKKWKENLKKKSFLKHNKMFKKGLASTYNNIGVIYDDQGEIDMGLKYFFLSLKIRSEIKDKKGMVYSYNNIGVSYENQGEIEKGLEYYSLSLNLSAKIKDKIGMANSYHNIGSILCKLDSLDRGLRYFGLGLELDKELEYKAGESSSNSTIGGWQLKMGQVEAALESGLKAPEVPKEIGHVEYIQRAAGLLSDVYKKQIKFEEAITMYELEIEMRDSLLNEKNTKATISQQMKYEHEKEQIIKEQQEIAQARIQAAVTSRRDKLQYSAIFISILILFGGVLMLGFVKVRPKDVEGIIFISFLILFEFVLVLADPHIEQYTGGAPGYKLLFNAGIAGLMFPLHQFFEGKLKMRVIKIQRKKLQQRMDQYKKDIEQM